MKTGKIRTAVLAVVYTVAAGFGMAACNTGTDAGDTNVERSGIEQQEEMTGKSKGTRDTTDYEHHYDHADHPDSTALGSGAYNQDGQRDKRP